MRLSAESRIMVAGGSFTEVPRRMDGVADRKLYAVVFPVGYNTVVRRTAKRTSLRLVRQVSAKAIILLLKRMANLSALDISGCK